MEWTAEGEYTPKQDYIKFEVAPDETYVRVHGDDTPPESTLMYFDNIAFQKYSDYDIEAIGSDILTLGTVSTTPDISIEAMGTIEGGTIGGGETEGNPSTHTDSTNVGATSILTYQLQDFYNYTIVGIAGKKYRVDKVGIKGCVASDGGRCDSKIEVYFDSTLMVSYTFSSTTVLPTYTTHTASPNLICEAGQSISFKYYIKSSTTAIRAYIRDATNTVTEILTTPTVTTDAGISVFNVADPLTVMRLCNKVFPGIKSTINADGTGLYVYSENFATSRYQSAVLSRTGDSYLVSAQQILITGNLTWEFDTLYPITSIPYAYIYVVSGTPKLEISEDNVLWYACDSNTSSSITSTRVVRELDNVSNFRLSGTTKFYLRISPASGALTLSSIDMFVRMITMDAEHPVIYETGEANTFEVIMTNDVPCIISLKYPDKHWI